MSETTPSEMKTEDMETTSFKEESEKFVDALEEFPEDASLHSVDRQHSQDDHVDDEPHLDRQDAMDPFALRVSHLIQIASLVRLRKLCVETDFGKVIGKTELVLSDLFSRANTYYDKPQSYELDFFTSSVVMGDNMRRSGVLGGSMEFEGLTAGIFCVLILII